MRCSAASANNRAANRYATGALLAGMLLLQSCAPPYPPGALERPLPPAYPPPEAPSPEQADALLADHIYLALNQDRYYFFRHVDVQVDNGVANLSGFVWSSDAIYRARQITRRVPGVTQVVTSNLELERNGKNSGPAR
jgi:hypothetical protein